MEQNTADYYISTELVVYSRGRLSSKTERGQEVLHKYLQIAYPQLSHIVSCGQTLFHTEGKGL